MPSPILVTGATGNVGREVIKELTRLGEAPRAAVFGAASAAVEGAPATPFDFRNPATWDAALADVQRMFLMRPPEMADVDATLIPFLNHAKANGLRHVVFLSLIGAENNKRVPHYAVEQAVLASGIPFTFVRPGFFMQNINTAYRDDIRFRNEVIVPAGKGALSFIDVRDIAAVIAKALHEEGHAGKAYAITGSESLDYWDVARVLSEELGRTIVYTKPSSGAYRRHQESLGAAADYIQVMNGIYFPVRMGWAGGITDEFSKLMGRQPIRLAQYVHDYREAWSEPTADERAAYAARLAAIPAPPRRSLIERLRMRFGGPGRIGV